MDVSTELGKAARISSPSPSVGSGLAAAHKAASPLLGDPALDRVAHLVAELLGAEAVQISLVTDVWTVAGSFGTGQRPAVGSGPLTEALSVAIVRAQGVLAIEDTASDPRMEGLPATVRHDVGAFLGTPLREANASVIGTLCVLHPTPRQWSDMDVRTVRRLAAFTLEEVERTVIAGNVEAAQSRWTLAVGAAAIGGFDIDLRTDRIVLDERMQEIFGFAPGTFDGTMATYRTRIHPDDAERVAAAGRDAIERRAAYEVEFRVAPSGGRARWVRLRARVLSDADGAAVRVLGAAYDTTSAKEMQTRVARALEAMAAPFITLDNDWRITFLNAEGERVLNRSREELLGQDVWEMFPHMVGTPFEWNFRSAAATDKTAHFEAYYSPLNSWYDVGIAPTPDGLLVHFEDVTERHLVQRRTAVLAQFSADLAGSLNPGRLAAQVASLVVPALADWCVVSLVDEDEQQTARGWLADVGTAHRDPAKAPLVERYAQVRMESVTDPALMKAALVDGQRAVISDGATAKLLAMFAPGEARDLVEALAPESAVVLPLLANGRALGLLSLFYDADSEHGASGELETAVLVASRTALALDNARLYQSQRRIAEGLQRSLLGLPDPAPELEAVVRYEPAKETAQVGGDWYDVFRQESGPTMIVIGDVSGHDIGAAAVMGQLRGLVRGIAAVDGLSPAAVLTRMDATMHVLGDGTAATAVVAQMSRPTGPGAPDQTQLRWSNAGHLPPVLVDADGTVSVLSTSEADLLLGLDATTKRTESVAWLCRGATLLLYTDGLVERRGQSLDEGIEGLRATVAALGDLPLDELVDGVLRRMLPERPEDDVAIAAVRVRR